MGSRLSGVAGGMEALSLEFGVLLVVAWLVLRRDCKVKFDSKVKLRQDSNCCKRVLEASKLAHANKTKESITSQKCDSRDF